MAGSDEQRRAPVNSTYAMTFSACAYMLKCLIDPDLPVNDGFYRVLEVVAPEGTVTNCRWPAAVVGGWETHDRLVEVLLRAVLHAMPERIPAGTKGMNALRPCARNCWKRESMGFIRCFRLPAGPLRSNPCRRARRSR